MNPIRHTLNNLRITASGVCLGLGLILGASGTLAPELSAQHGPPPVVDGQALPDASALGQKAALDVSFVDENGESVVLRDLANSERPTILNLGFYQCPGVCSTVLNSFLRILTDSELVPGRDFDLVTISFDHQETPELAFQKRQSYLGEVAGLHGGQQQAWTEDWHFLTGTRESVLELTDSCGWNFRYNEKNRTGHDHPPVIVVIAPDGTITRHLEPAAIGPSTLRRAVIEASDGKVGSALEQLFVTCLTYDPTTGRYTMTAMTIMKIGGVLFVLALSVFLFFMWRRERARHAATPDGTTPAPHVT